MSNPIRAISLWQPWANAMATFRQGTRLPIKAVETRHWFPKVEDCTGDSQGFWLAIHAAKKPWKATANYDSSFLSAVRLLRLDAWPITYGAILCVAWVEKIAKVDDLLASGEVGDLENLFGNYVNVGDDGEFQQRYGWTTDPSKLKILKTPIPYRGEQGIFTWDVPEGLEYKWVNGN